MKPRKDANPLNLRDKLVQLRASPRLVAELEAATDGLHHWWWVCLRESDDYARALAGELPDPWAGVARDFGELGDVFGVWWLTRGRQLFGPEVRQPEVMKLNDPKEFVSDDIFPNMLVEVPLTLPRKDIIKQFTRLLDMTLDKQAPPAGSPSGIPRHLYPDQRTRPETIKSLLEVWRARKAGGDEAWWETGERLGHWPQYHAGKGDGPEAIKDKRRLMSLTVQRLHRMASALISNAAKGYFPRIK